MEITKEYLQQKIAECQKAKEEHLANANANQGAVHILEVILSQLNSDPIPEVKVG